MSDDDVGLLLARHAAEMEYDRIPAGALEAARTSILDTLAVIVAATGSAPKLDSVAELMIEAGGRPESTVFCRDVKLPSWEAAFVNGAYAHAIDYDDVHEGRLCHPSAPVVVAALALAERRGGVSGTELLAAVAVGQDVFVRLSGSVACWTHKLHTSLTLGGLAAAAAASRILGLSADECFAALGVVSCRSAGPNQVTINTGSELRAMYNAFPARDAVVAALIAQRGMAGIGGLFDGKYGLANALFDGRYDRELLVGGLGTDFPATDTSYKAWPSCRFTHGYIDATLRLIEAWSLRPDDIATVEVRVSEALEDLCTPRSMRYTPTSLLDAKFSIPFCVGIAISKRDVCISDFTESSIRDPDLLAQVAKVTYVVDPDFNQPSAIEMPPSMVEITTVTGDQMSQRVDFVRGHPANPMTSDDLTAKVRDCFRHAAKPFAESDVAEVIELVRVLEDVEDVAVLASSLA